MRIAVISDLDTRGSGYFNIITPICDGLGKLGYEIKIAGLGYKGDEHWFDFSIIPARDMSEVASIIQNLNTMWGFDVLLVALDIPLQNAILANLGQPRTYKYVGIFPVESKPLSLDWAMGLSGMDKAFVISEFGAEEVRKRNVLVEHLIVGVDPAWRPPEEGEREELRKAYGIPEDAFVVLTVADNQERKNLPASMAAFARMSEKIENARHVIVTRINFFAGWNLDELALELGITGKFIPMERGMPFKELWGIYALSDVFILLSKSEGLCMPTLEAMSVGLPVVATNCTAQIEHLSDGRGFLIDYLESEDYWFPPPDPFGLGRRYWANIKQAAITLENIATGKWKHDREAALKYVQTRLWDDAIKQVHEALMKLYE